jgi:hypothetical protein
MDVYERVTQRWRSAACFPFGDIRQEMTASRHLMLAFTPVATATPPVHIEHGRRKFTSGIRRDAV